jgi:hypothetical protein
MPRLSSSKNKHKEEQRPKKHISFKKKSKSRAMVVDASEVDTSSTYTTTSSTLEDEGSRCKDKRHVNYNFNGLSRVTMNGYCTMAHSANNKKAKHNESDSNFENEVCDDPISLRR